MTPAPDPTAQAWAAHTGNPTTSRRTTPSPRRGSVGPVLSEQIVVATFAATTVAGAMATEMASPMATAVASGVAASSRPVELAAATTLASTVATRATPDRRIPIPTLARAFRVVAGSASTTGPAPTAGQAGRTGRVALATAATAVVVVLSMTGLLNTTPGVAVAESPRHRSSSDASPADHTSVRRWPEPSTEHGRAGAPILAQGAAGGGGDGNQLFTVLTNIIRWGQSLLVLLATAAFVAGGLRYLWAFGDLSEIDAAKRTVKAAVIGFGIAALASALASILSSIFGLG